MNNIKWLKNKVVDMNNITELERKWGISFPTSYVDIVKSHDGSNFVIINPKGEPKTAVIPVRVYDESDFRLISLTDVDYNNISDIEGAYNTYRESLPDMVFPFGENAGGDMFLFDYRTKEKEPLVMFMQHEYRVTADDLDDDQLQEKPLGEWLESNLHLVANSFSEMLQLASIVEY